MKKPTHVEANLQEVFVMQNKLLSSYTLFPKTLTEVNITAYIFTCITQTSLVGLNYFLKGLNVLQNHFPSFLFVIKDTI